MMARDLLRSVLESLGARRLRTVLLTLGPAFGVAAIVGVVGVSESARGEIAAALRALGSDLVVVEAAGAPRQGAAPERLPAGAVARVRQIPGVRSAAQVTALPEVQVRTSPVDESIAPSAQVRAVGSGLDRTLGLEVASGRPLTAVDERTAMPTAVVGAALAQRIAVVGPDRTLTLDGHTFAIVGTLRPATVAPELDQSVLVTRATAARLSDDRRATAVYARVDPARVAAVTELLPVVVTYGGPGALRVQSPTELLAAGAEMDRTLRTTVLALGALTLVVGGFAIGNVLSITVLQRAPEIGIRRAIGHTRASIGWQFLLEATVVGLVGGAIGVALGSAATVVVAARQHWHLVLDPEVMVLAGLMAAAVSAGGGAIPALRATRIEPMRALRLR